MDSRTQISLIEEMYEALTCDKRDIVVMQAITSVTDRQPIGGEVSPGDRVRAIYDEVRRLDQARVHGTAAPTDARADTLAYHMA